MTVLAAAGRSGSGSGDLEWEVSELEVLGKYIEHADHLREDEHAMSTFTQSQQQLVQQNQLTTALY